MSILMDSCNVMRGSKSGVEKRIRDGVVPHLLEIDVDSCHYAHNACKQFCKQFNSEVQQVLRDIITDFKWSADLCEILEEMCLLLKVKYTMPEKYVATR